LSLNASFLVEKEKEDRFSEAVKEIDEEYGGAQLKYTGPWPPYNFIDIDISGGR